MIVATVSAMSGFFKTTAMAAGAPRPQSSLRIVVQEGDGAVNVIRKNQVRARRIAVQVVDGDKPLSGATVTFRMPAPNEPGGTIRGQTAVSVLTGMGGIAKMTFTPNRLVGTFDVDVIVNSQGRSSATFVTETNVKSAANAIGHDTLWRLIGLGFAAVTVAVLLANPSRSTQKTPPVLPR